MVNGGHPDNTADRPSTLQKYMHGRHVELSSLLHLACAESIQHSVPNKGLGSEGCSVDYSKRLGNSERTTKGAERMRGFYL